MQIGHLKRLSLSALLAVTAASLSSANLADGNRVPKTCSHSIAPKANSGVAAARRDKNRRKAVRRKARK